MRVSRFNPQYVVSTPTDGEPQPAPDTADVEVKPTVKAENQTESEEGEPSTNSRLGKLIHLIEEVQKRREKEKRKRQAGGLGVYQKLISFDEDLKKRGSGINKLG